MSPNAPFFAILLVLFSGLMSVQATKYSKPLATLFGGLTIAAFLLVALALSDDQTQPTIFEETLQ